MFKFNIWLGDKPPRLIAKDIEGYTFAEAVSRWYHTNPDAKDYGELTFDESNTKPYLYGIGVYSSRQEIYKKTEYIICSAIKRITPKDNPFYSNNDIFNIELGWAHCDILVKFRGEVSKKCKDQGFYTSKGRFVDRLEAMDIAIKANQVRKEELHNPRSGLFSEDLYV